MPIIYEGIVTGNFVKLPEEAKLPEGTTVAIVVKKLPKHKKGSPQAILQLIKSLPALNEEAAENLSDAIKDGRCAVDWTNPLEKSE